MKTIKLWMSMLLMCVFMVATAMAEDSPVFDVPQLDKIKVDGDPADWGDRGFRAGALTSAEGETPPAADLDAGFRLGWDQRGLLVLVTVSDDVGLEHPDAGQLWLLDSVELFVAIERGSPQYYQVVFSPGFDPEHLDLRRSIHDHRRDKLSPERLTVEAARTRTKTGYVLEVLLPWENLAITPIGAVLASARGEYEQMRRTRISVDVDDEISFQLYVNDADDSDGRSTVIWYPRFGTHANPSAMHRLRLMGAPGLAVSELAGRMVEVRAGNQTLARGNLVADAHHASAHFSLPMPPPRGTPYGELTIFLDGEPFTTVNLPNADEQRARAFMDAELYFRPAVFSGTEFPPCEFEQPSWIEDLIGPYTIKTTFYDSDYKVVTSAEKPGRYGAVVEIIPDSGRVSRRFRTLFRQPGEVQWWRPDVAASFDLFELPEGVGIAPAVVVEQSRVVREHLKSRFVDGFSRDVSSGALLAGLYETKPGSGEAGIADDVWAKDRQWWVGLKRKFYGIDELYSKPFVCPRPMDGTPTLVLHEGTLTEAGMKPDAAEKIDAVCRAWAAESDEAFAVCVARHGIIVLHKAYGQRDGHPMTVNDRSWMASITKLLSGTLMMMLVDQDLVGLDGRVDTFLPALRGIEVKTPLAIRHLYTHTNGLWGHWGDDLNDFEEIIADYYPHLAVGEQHSYNGAGYALGGKVMEAVSGEAIPQFYKRHLLDPLGCSNTQVTNMSWDASSTPMDIAKIGQMLVNRGAYGQMRFFSEQTFEKMLPEKLTKMLGPETAIEWGIGVTWANEPGLGKGTFGHGAASAATLRIDPVNDLVIVMTRNTAGTQYEKYYPQFIASIGDGIMVSAGPASER
ncbi:MAG: serine hydrolase [Candidatus Latescibacterota bacterium]